MAKTLHLTNGQSFTNRLSSLLPEADILSWNEILCEGPTSSVVFSEAFIEERINFLKRFEDEANSKYLAFIGQFEEVSWENVEEVVFWFEYDLFCHINLAAAITYVTKKAPNATYYLVCSGEIEGKEGLFGLSELPDDDLWNEYSTKVTLGSTDLHALLRFWKMYASGDHSQLHTIEFNKEHFPYMEACIQAHYERFPFKDNGLNALELMVLKAIAANDFDSTHQLVGYLLRNQGYYGFGDSQWFDIVDRVLSYFDQSPLRLNEKGKALLQGNYNAFGEISSTALFGQCPKYNYLYNPSTQAIEKR